jgi:hypothetical protein
MQPDAPFSAMTLAYLSDLMPSLAHPKTPHPIINPTEPEKRIEELVESCEAELKHIV